MAASVQRRYSQSEIRTNVLPDIVYTEWDSEIVGAPEKRERVNVVEKISPQTRAARRTAALAISLISIVFALFAGIVWRYAIISEVGKDNRELETKIEDYDSRIDSLNIGILEKSDLRDVQEKASLLSMGFADNSQIRYIELSNDNTHNSEAAEKPKEEGFFQRLLEGKF